MAEAFDVFRYLDRRRKPLASWDSPYIIHSTGYIGEPYPIAVEKILCQQTMKGILYISWSDTVTKLPFMNHIVFEKQIMVKLGVRPCWAFDEQMTPENTKIYNIPGIPYKYYYSGYLTEHEWRYYGAVMPFYRGCVKSVWLFRQHYDEWKPRLEKALYACSYPYPIYKAGYGPFMVHYFKDDIEAHRNAPYWTRKDWMNIYQERFNQTKRILGMVV